MKSFYRLFVWPVFYGLLCSIQVSAQITTPYLYDSADNNWSDFGINETEYRSTLGIPSHRFTFQAASSTTEFYKIYNQGENFDNDFNSPFGSQTWSGSLSNNTLGTIFLYGDGNGSAGSFPTVVSRTYSLIWEDVSGVNARGTIMETSNMPVGIVSVSYLPTNPTPGTSVTVTVQLDGVPVEDLPYVRYSTNGFGTYGSLLQASAGSGTTTQTFIIPGQPNHTSILFYAFTSTVPFASLNGNAAMTDIGTIAYNNNGGSNYAFTVLPIELLHFTADPAGKTIDLHWSTASEYNNDYFDIQRSPDSKNWISLAHLKGHQYSTSEQDYQWTDRVPVSGLNYYRLRQVDVDGQFTYSSVVQGRMDAGAGTNVTPNPVQGNFLRIVPSEAIQTVQIFNLSGQLLKHWTVEVPAGELLTLDLEGIPAGILLLQVNDQVPVRIEKY